MFLPRPDEPSARLLCVHRSIGRRAERRRLDNQRAFALRLRQVRQVERCAATRAGLVSATSDNGHTSIRVAALAATLLPRLLGSKSSARARASVVFVSSGCLCRLTAWSVVPTCQLEPTQRFRDRFGFEETAGRGESSAVDGDVAGGWIPFICSRNSRTFLVSSRKVRLMSCSRFVGRFMCLLYRSNARHGYQVSVRVFASTVYAMRLVAPVDTPPASIFAAPPGQF